MPFIEIGGDGISDGTNEVVVVEAPAVNTRRLVRHITIVNPMESESVLLTLFLENSGNERLIWKGTLYGGDAFDSDDDLYVLDAVAKSIRLYLSATPTTELSWTVSYGDASERVTI
jgi:hypothetical protein